MAGVVGYGAYVPYWRVERADVAATLRGRSRPGTRAVASFDEDATTMGVEAARRALRALEDAGTKPLLFATTEPPYLDKTNANAVHAALDLDAGAPAFDLVGGTRSGVGAVLAAASLGGIAVIADLRTGAVGSDDETAGGDAAASLVFGDHQVVAELAGTGHATRELMERWRLPGEKASRRADEHFVEHVYGKLTEHAVADALKAADIGTDEIDHLILTGTYARVARGAARAFGDAADRAVADLTDVIGFTGAAHWALLLTDVLDRAAAHEHIAVVTMGDGVDVMVFHTTSHLDAHRADRERQGIPTLADQIGSPSGTLAYARFLAWRGMLVEDSPLRADPQPFSAIAAERNVRWKFGLVESRDDADSVRLADVPATITALTVDHASPSPGAPLLHAVIDFDTGTRMTIELTDVDVEQVRVGDRVEMTFRRLQTSAGMHDYFWKARPLPRHDWSVNGTTWHP